MTSLDTTNTLINNNNDDDDDDENNNDNNNDNNEDNNDDNNDDNNNPVVEENRSRLQELEKEVLFLRAKLSRKEKTWSEQVQRAETAQQTTEQQLIACQGALQKTKTSLRLAEKQLETQEDSMKQFQKQDKTTVQVSALEEEIHIQTCKIKDREDTIATLQNEMVLVQTKLGEYDTKLSQVTELEH